MVRRKPTQPADETITRRTLLEWLGRGAVLGLGGAVVASCLGGGAGAGDAGGSDGDGQDSVADRPAGGDAGGDTGAGDQGAGEFSFAPGDLDDPVFQGWGERTVDRQDLEDILASWRLRVDGLVEQPRVYNFADLANLPRSDMLVDFHCVEGWSVYDVPWNGVHPDVIVDQVRPRAAATHVTFHTIGDKYNESLPLEVFREPRTLLAYGIAGNTLPLIHGFPLRVVIPRLFGYKNAKYVYRIEFTDRPIEGFWVSRGYSYAGEVPPGRLRPGKY